MRRAERERHEGDPARRVAGGRDGGADPHAAERREAARHQRDVRQVGTVRAARKVRGFATARAVCCQAYCGPAGAVAVILVVSAIARWRHSPRPLERGLEPGHRSEATGKAHVGDRIFAGGKQLGGMRDPPFHKVPVRRGAGDRAEHVNHPGAAQSHGGASRDSVELGVGVCAVDQLAQLPGELAVASSRRGRCVGRARRGHQRPANGVESVGCVEVRRLRRPRRWRRRCCQHRGARPGAAQVPPQRSDAPGHRYERGSRGRNSLRKDQAEIAVVDAKRMPALVLGASAARDHDGRRRGAAALP